jgi:hypothetical protein
VGEYAIGKKDVTASKKDVQFENSDFINIYPNPARNLINIHIKKQFKNIVLSITDISGKTIKSINLKSDLNEIDLSYLDKGQYIFVFQIDGNVVSKSVLAN